MSTTQDERLIRDAFAPARSLEPTQAEISQVLSRANVGVGHLSSAARRGRDGHLTWRRLASAGFATFVLLAGGGYAAAPPVRAAINGVASSFAGWLDGDSNEAPGRPLGNDEQAPDYFRDPRYILNPRVIAEADGYKLYAARDAHGKQVAFDLGDTGVGVGLVSSDIFRDQVVLVLGPGAMQKADEHGHVPLFGITARAVKSIQLTYDSGPPLRVDAVNGGFVLLAQPDRGPHEVIALAADGHELGRAVVDDSSHPGPQINWKQYGPAPPRMPSECQPGAADPERPKKCPAG